MAKEPFCIWKVGEETYRLRLDTAKIIEVERTLGKSLLNASADTSLTSILTILHGAIQRYQHGITIQEIYKIYDRYVSAGGSMFEVLDIIMKVLENAGFTAPDSEINPEPDTEL